MLAVVLLLLAHATVAESPAGFDLARLRSLSAMADCARGAGETVVCGRRSGRDRLPLPLDSDPDAGRLHDTPSGMAALTPAAPCGIFQGQRSCSKAEARRYGYGGGRDPLTLAGKLAGALIHPE